MLSYLLLVPMLPNVQENMFFDGSISLVNFFNMWKWYHLESCNWVESGSEKPFTFGCFLKKKCSDYYLNLAKSYLNQDDFLCDSVDHSVFLEILIHHQMTGIIATAATKYIIGKNS